MIDPNKVTQQRKRSSLKNKHLFPDNISYEDWLQQHKQKKIQFMTSEYSNDSVETDTKSKFKVANAKFKEVVKNIFTEGPRR